MPIDAAQFLHDLSDRARGEFDAHRRRLSFGQFLDLFVANPRRYARSAAQYVADMIDHFGRKAADPLGGPSGFNVFCPPDAPAEERVVGQHLPQEELYRLLRGFAHAGRAHKLVVLHGPNGSAKSSLVAALMRGLEAYSRTDEGALYCFHWVFPEERPAGGGLGFSSGAPDRAADVDSYALLPDERIALRLVDEQRDSPLMLLPLADRRGLFDRLRAASPDFAALTLSPDIARGDLSGKSRAVFDALFNAYHGDLARVLRHVQVERWFVSRRYKRGAVVLEPEMSVDAGIRQISMDRRLNSLPAALQSLSLFEASGRLIDANHGVIEYSDLLKRPMEAYKYLLATTEKATVDLDAVLVHLDLVMLGSANDGYLDAFKQTPDFPSFRGRMEFVKVPYLFNFRDEAVIYRNQLRLDEVHSVVAPHVIEVAALWAVLTRMKPPNPERHPDKVRELLGKLTPLDKALLYSGEMPGWMTESQKQALRGIRNDLIQESYDEDDYEGNLGVSPREIKTLLLQAAHSGRYGAVVPMAVFDEIERLIANPSNHPFLRARPSGPYLNQPRLLEYVRHWYLDVVDTEVKQCLNLVEEGQYDQLFRKYAQQLSAWRKKERVFNPVTRRWEDTDTRFLSEVEKRIGIERDAEQFRAALLNRIAAWALENPNQEINYRVIFEQHIQRLERDYYESQKRAVARVASDAARLLGERAPEMGEGERADGQRLIDALTRRYGYAAASLREVLRFLIHHRY